MVFYAHEESEAHPKRLSTTTASKVNHFQSSERAPRLKIFFASFWSTSLYLWLINFNCVAQKEPLCGARRTSPYRTIIMCVCLCRCVAVLLECVISQCHTVLWELRWRGQWMLHSTSVCLCDLQRTSAGFCGIRKYIYMLRFCDGEWEISEIERAHRNFMSLNCVPKSQNIWYFVPNVSKS